MPRSKAKCMRRAANGVRIWCDASAVIPIATTADSDVILGVVEMCGIPKKHSHWRGSLLQDVSE